jgi:ornithine carbamoyltransferase
MHVAVACPQGYEPNPAVVEKAKALAESPEQIQLLREPEEAVRGAQVLYTDVWASMGQEAEAAQRRKVFARYQINRELLAMAEPEAIVMHCLPAHRGEEITEEVIEGPQSVVFDEAENRMHAHKAILAALLG